MIEMIELNNRDRKNSSIDLEQAHYNPFRIPPDIQECKFHRLVTQFGSLSQRVINRNDNTNGENTLGLNQNRNPLSPLIRQNLIQPSSQRSCPCCEQLEKQQLHLGCRIQEIYKVNESAGYFFTYLKVMGLMLVLIVLIIGVHAFYYVITACNQQKNCLKIYGIPVPQFHVFFTQILISLQLVILLIMYGFIAYLYYKNIKIQKKVYFNHRKPSDFSVLLTGVDHSKVENEQSIKNYFAQNGRFQIVDVLYTHKVSKFVKNLSKKSILQAKLDLYQERSEDLKMREIISQINEINNKIATIRQRFEYGQQISLRTDKVIIKLGTTRQKHRFELLFKQTIYQTIYRKFCGQSLIEINSNKIHLEPLGQPNEMIWQNLQMKSEHRYIRIFVGNMATTIIVICSYMVIAYLTKREKAFKGTNDVIFSVIFSIVIECTNFVLDKVFQRIVEWEKRYTYTGEKRAILIQNFIYFFLNTTISPFTLFVFAWGYPDQDDLIRNIFTLFLLTNFVSPFVSLFVQPSEWWASYKKHKIKKEGKNCMIVQNKANKYFERNNFDLCARYSTVIQIITNSIFYAAVFPVGVLITMIGLFLTYWINKWWLLKHCSIPKLSYRLGRLVNDITVWFPCILAFGYALNITIVTGFGSFQQIISFSIAFLTLIISLIFLTLGNTIAEGIVYMQYRDVHRYRSDQQLQQLQQSQPRRLPEYRQLNPTTFFISQERRYGNVLDHLEDYVSEKASSFLRRGGVVGSGESVEAQYGE